MSWSIKLFRVKGIDFFEFPPALEAVETQRLTWSVWRHGPQCKPAEMSPSRSFHR